MNLHLFPEGKLPITLDRLCCQLIESYGDFADTVAVGVQPRGVHLARRMAQHMRAMRPDLPLPFGELDVTFFRDDVSRKDVILSPSKTDMPFVVEGKRVILIDDVLYTGRTVRAALSAMLAFGRPRQVALLVLVHRRHFEEFPVRPSFVGITVDTHPGERVEVRLSPGGDAVYLTDV